MIYLAAPLFSEAEITFNANLAAELEAAGCEVFLPQLNPMLVGALDLVVVDRAALIDALAEGDGSHGPRGAEAGDGQH